MASKGKDDNHRGDDNDRDDEHDNNNHHKKEYASKLPDRKYGYFRDDQITFLVTHQQEISDQVLKDFAAGINDKLKRLDSEVVKKKPHVIHTEATSFRPMTPKEIEQSRALLSPEEVDSFTKRFSYIRCDLKDAPDDPSMLLDIVKALNNQASPNPRDLSSQQALGGPQASNKGLNIAGFTIQGTSLNWLTSVTSNGSGTGGPGGRPSPYYGSRKNAPYHLDIVTQLKKKNIYGDGEGVDVVILDTAPCAQDLVAAYKEWPDHPLIATLLGPKGKLHLYPATYDELLRLGCLSLNDHDYKMTDHGLFIAGIIHSIVPKAEIHLIEVLNQYGVGDFQSFTQGLQLAWDEIYTNHPNRKLVINCSWMLDFPLDENQDRNTGPVGDPDAEFARRVLEFAAQDRDTLLQLEFLFTQFYGVGRQAVAAAGNDARTGDKKRTAARFPAALRRVTGVGALPKSLAKGGNGKYLTSVFSNFSESRNNQGIVKTGVVTFGGEEGEGKGVLGLYIGEFPGCPCNESKWAWWAGTSFATPILTGAIASVLSTTVTTTQDAYEKIRKKPGGGFKIILEGQVGKKENAMLVKQS